MFDKTYRTKGSLLDRRKKERTVLQKFYTFLLNILRKIGVKL